MKKILLFFTACALLSSCNFLNMTDPDSFDESKFYKSQDDMERLLASSYEAFREATNNMFFVTEMKSDNATTNDGGSSAGLYVSFVNHQVMSSNTIVYNLYTDLYQCIHRANLTIEHLNDITWGSQDEKNRVLAEAKFMRALAHFYLVRLWGPVTKMDHTITSTATANKAVRSSEEEVYQFIIQDLTEAAQLSGMPNTYSAGSEMYGHASKTAVYAMLGRVYMQYAATMNHPEAYNSAITALKQAETLGNYPTVNIKFADLFTVANKQNAEIIFSVQYKATEEQCSPFAAFFQIKSGQLSYGTARGFNLGEINLVNEFDAQAATDGRKVTALKAYNKEYYTPKYKDLKFGVKLAGNDWYELRFADVYLMLAEAYERTNNAGEAVKYLDMVRTRPGNGLQGWEDSKKDATYDAKYSDLRAAIFHERRLELCFENQRWFDLRRLYPDKEALAAYMRSITVVDQAAVGNKFTDFKAYEALLPIPYNETYLNPNLGQNEGYTSH